MTIRPYSAALLLSLALCLPAFAADKPAELKARADAHAADVGNVDLFVGEVMAAVDMAGAGEYGRLRRGELGRLERSRDTIVELLDGHRSALELTPEERIELYNAQETITAIIRNDDKSRVVCMKEVRTGSRVPKTECLSVAEREHRARSAATSAQDIVRTVCIPGQDGISRCGK